MSKWDNILQNGELFVPSSKHYSHLGFVLVNCDRCKKENIKCSIGYRDVDMCLDCAAVIERRSLNLRPPPPMIGEPNNIQHLPIFIRLDPNDNKLKSFRMDS